MNLEDAIRTRRSIRKYQEREVPTEMILKAISLAMWAPSGGNYQPWRFFVIKNRELIDRIADTVQAKVDQSYHWPELEGQEELAHKFRRNAAFFRSASAVIAVIGHTTQSTSDRVLKLRGEQNADAAEMIRNRAAVASRIQTTAGATAYLLLALHNLGLGACWMTGPMLARPEIEAMLDLPPGLELFSLVPVGYPAQSPEPGPRKPIEEVVRVLE